VWDWAAGGLIAAEAGAVLRLPPADGTPGVIVASAPAVADALAAVLQRAEVL
jgi:myo-inositol-1(or 4)-monophosphatase